MPKRLTTDELKRRALTELAKAQIAHREIESEGRTAPRINRLRAANGRGGRYLERAVRRGLLESEACKLYESNAPPDPEFGVAVW